jgi:hypothetical protein
MKRCPACKGRGHVFDAASLVSPFFWLLIPFERKDPRGVTRQRCERCRGKALLGGVDVFRFVLPFSDGTVFNVALGGKDLAEAYSEYKRYYWSCETPGAIAVFHNAALVARVLPVYDEETDSMRPKLKMWK